MRLKQEVDVGSKLDPLSAGHSEQAVVVQDRVQTLYPLWIYVPVTHDPRAHLWTTHTHTPGAVLKSSIKAVVSTDTLMTRHTLCWVFSVSLCVCIVVALYGFGLLWCDVVVGWGGMCGVVWVWCGGCGAVVLLAVGCVGVVVCVSWGRVCAVV